MAANDPPSPPPHRGPDNTMEVELDEVEEAVQVLEVKNSSVPPPPPPPRPRKSPPVPPAKKRKPKARRSGPGDVTMGGILDELGKRDRR